MTNSFFAAFDPSLREAQRVMGESWALGNIEYEAIAMDALSATDRAALGGRFVDVSMTVHVSLSVFTNSGVRKGSVIVARGAKVRVTEIQNDGDDARTLLCGPVNIEAPR
jgi:hypothetical protein